MDLNNYDFTSFDDDDDNTSQVNPNMDLTQMTLNTTPTFSQIISGSENYQNFDDFGNPMSLSQLPTENFVEQTPLFCSKKSKKPSSSQKNPCNSKKNENRNWSENEDEALMSAWCICSTDPIAGKNQTNFKRWNDVFAIYEQSRVENQNQKQLGIRSLDAMKSRFKRLNFLVNKWVGCYSQVLNRPHASGTNITDDIKSAQNLFSKSNAGVEFDEFNVFNKVMSKHPKWALQNTQYNVTSDVCTSSSKRSVSDMGSSPSTNVGTPTSSTPAGNSDVDVNIRPEGREAAKKKRKGKNPISESMFSEDDISRLDEHRIAIEAQVQQRQRRIEADLEIEQLRILKMKTKMEMTMLNTLLLQQDLNPKDQEMKEKLQNKYMSDL